MKRLLCVLVATASAGLAGCVKNSDGASAGPADSGLFPRRSSSQPGDQAEKNYLLIVRIQMATVILPAGSVSGSEELWSRLNEESVPAFRSGNLGRNGFRVGLTPRSSWPAVASVLERLTGQPIRMTTMASLPGEPLTVSLKVHEPEQTIFVYQNDRGLAGQDYPPGDNVLGLSCTIDENDPGRVLVTAVPQIRSTELHQRIVMDRGPPVFVSLPDIVSFDAMTFQASVPSNDVIIIGPGSEARRPSSLGRHFLMRQKSGMTYESVLVLVPEVFAAPMPAN